MGGGSRWACKEELLRGSGVELSPKGTGYKSKR